jgi:hypothetical protein
MEVQFTYYADGPKEQPRKESNFEKKRRKKKRKMVCHTEQSL